MENTIPHPRLDIIKDALEKAGYPPYFEMIDEEPRLFVNAYDETDKFILEFICTSNGLTIKAFPVQKKYVLQVKESYIPSFLRELNFCNEASAYTAVISDIGILALKMQIYGFWQENEEAQSPETFRPLIEEAINKELIDRLVVELCCVIDILKDLFGDGWMQIEEDEDNNEVGEVQETEG